MDNPRVNKIFKAVEKRFTTPTCSREEQEVTEEIKSLCDSPDLSEDDKKSLIRLLTRIHRPFDIFKYVISTVSDPVLFMNNCKDVKDDLILHERFREFIFFLVSKGVTFEDSELGPYFLNKDIEWLIYLMNHGLQIPVSDVLNKIKLFKDDKRNKLSHYLFHTMENLNYNTQEKKQIIDCFMATDCILETVIKSSCTQCLEKFIDFGFYVYPKSVELALNSTDLGCFEVLLEKGYVYNPSNLIIYEQKLAWFRKIK